MFLSCPPEPVAQEVVTDDPGHRRRNPIDTLGEKAGRLVDDGIEVTGDPRGNAWSPTRTCLGQSHPPTLTHGCGGDDPRSAVPGPQLVLAHSSWERQPVLGMKFGSQPLESVTLVALPDDHGLEVRTRPTGN